MTATRGTTNGNARGSSKSRRLRREWLVQTYRANVDVYIRRIPGLEDRVIRWPVAEDWIAVYCVPDAVEWWTRYPACRCYRCGDLLTVDTVTVDRITPGCKGGTYRRDNIRPACGPCNSETGGGLRG